MADPGITAAPASGGVNTFGQDISKGGGSIVPSANAAPGSTPEVATNPQTASGGATSPISTTALSSPVAPITAPIQPSVNTGSDVNASIPTIASAIAPETAQTPAEQQQKGILSSIADLMKGNTSLATLQTTNEANQGVPAMTKTVNDLTTQLEGLNDQATELTNNASIGGSIDNTEQNDATGRGITTGGLAPLSAGDLRTNQIKQATVAAQALTVKATLAAASGNLTLAKSAADQAAQVAFDATTQQINYEQSLLNAITPEITQDQKAAADEATANLADRAAKVAQQTDDYKTGSALIIAAMKLNPNDSAAQSAAQQALQISPQDPDYLDKVSALVAQYQQDPNAVALQLAQIQEARASTAKDVVDTKVEEQSLGGGTSGDVLSALPQDQQTKLQSNGFTGYNPQTQSLAQQLVTGQIAPADLSKRSTGQSPYNSILTAANQYSLATTGKPFDMAQATRDFTFANNVQTQNTLNYLGSLVGSSDGNGGFQGGNLDALITQSKALGGTSKTLSDGITLSGQGTFPALNEADQWAKLQTGNPQVAAYYTTMLEVSDQIAKVLQGGGTGSGTSDAKLAQAQGLFQKGFTPAQVEAVAGSLQTLLGNRATNMIGNNPYLSDYAQQFGVSQNGSSSAQTVQSNGQTYSVGQVYQDGSGAKWTVDASGNWTKQ